VWPPALAPPGFRGISNWRKVRSANESPLDSSGKLRGGCHGYGDDICAATGCRTRLRRNFDGLSVASGDANAPVFFLASASCCILSARSRRNVLFAEPQIQSLGSLLHEVDARFSCGTPAVIGKASFFASVRAYFTSLVLLRDGRHTHLPSRCQYSPNNSYDGGSKIRYTF
jgi:hypothetical protein